MHQADPKRQLSLGLGPCKEVAELREHILELQAAVSAKALFMASSVNTRGGQLSQNILCCLIIFGSSTFDQHLTVLTGGGGIKRSNTCGTAADAGGQEQ